MISIPSCCCCCCCCVFFFFFFFFFFFNFKFFFFLRKGFIVLDHFNFIQVHFARPCFKTSLDTIAFLGLTLLRVFGQQLSTLLIYECTFIHIIIAKFNSKCFLVHVQDSILEFILSSSLDLFLELSLVILFIHSLDYLASWTYCP